MDFSLNSLLPPPTTTNSNENFNSSPPSPSRNELISDWLKFTRAWVLRRLLFGSSIMVGGGKLVGGRGVNRKDPGMFHWICHVFGWVLLSLVEIVIEVNFFMLFAFAIHFHQFVLICNLFWTFCLNFPKFQWICFIFQFANIGNFQLCWFGYVFNHLL